jgi:chromosome segregation ATPase
MNQIQEVIKQIKTSINLIEEKQYQRATKLLNDLAGTNYSLLEEYNKEFGEIDILIREKESLKEEVRDLESKIDDKDKEIDEKDDETTSLENDILQLNSKIQDLEQEVSILTDKNFELEEFIKLSQNN